jgi:negative regulator of flagellin synthesis FlgM
MTIDRLNSIDPIRDPSKASSSEKVSRAVRGDSIAISTDATQKGELYKAIEIAKAAPMPEARSELIASLKSKINDPSYINEAVVSATADRIIDQLLG